MLPNKRASQAGAGARQAASQALHCLSVSGRAAGPVAVWLADRFVLNECVGLQGGRANICQKADGHGVGCSQKLTEGEFSRQHRRTINLLVLLLILPAPGSTNQTSEPKSAGS